MKLGFVWGALLALTVCGGPAAGGPSSAPASTVTDPAGAVQAAVAASVRDLCGKKVVLLGEADHGDGATTALKVELVQLLVRQCGFNALFFEASHYDFLAIGAKLRRQENASPVLIASAIGGLWNYQAELQPLLSFLADRAQTGDLALGGLDDQLGSAGAFFSLDQMPVQLAGHLSPDRAAICGDLLKRRIYSAFRPYGPPERDRVTGCLDEIRDAVTGAARLPEVDREEALQMVSAYRRAVDRDFLDTGSLVTQRDRAMYENFLWLAQRLPQGSKIIVWSSNSHIAKDASALRHYAAAPNMGALIRADYGRRAFALAFSAAAGSHDYGREMRRLASAAPGSIEGETVGGRDDPLGYLGRKQLKQFGTVDASAFSHEPVRADWDDIFDGMIVLREERSPQRLSRQP